MSLYGYRQIAEIRAAKQIRPVHLLTPEKNMKDAFFLPEIGKREYRKSGTEADRPESSETPDHETAP